MLHLGSKQLSADIKIMTRLLFFSLFFDKAPGSVIATRGGK